jgi:hypothetical protein
LFVSEEVNLGGVVGKGGERIHVCMFRGRPKQGAGLLPFGGGVSGCEQPEVTDTNKPVGKDVEEKAADKHVGGQVDKPVGAGSKVVACAEGNRVSIKGEDTPEMAVRWV